MDETLESAGRRVGRNSLILLSGEIGGKLLGAIFMVLLARYLGTRVFGELSFALALATILGVVSDLGLGMLVSREVARRPDDAWTIVSPALRSRAALIVVLGVTAVAATSLGGKSTGAVALLAVLVATQLAQGQAEILAAAHRGRERMTLPVVSSLICRFGLFASGIVAILFEAPVLVFAALTTLWTLPLPFVLGRRLPGPRPARTSIWGCGALLKRAAPIGVGIVLWTIYFRIDLVLLGWLRGDAEVGLFAAPFRLVEAGLMLSGPLLAAVFPLLSRQEPGSEMFKAGLRQSVRVLALMGLPAAALVVAEAPAILQAVFGAGYADSARVFVILSLTIPVSFLSAPFLTALLCTNREGRYVRIMAAGAIANITLDLALIPRFGIDGAAAATLATEALVLGLALLTHRRAALSMLPLPALAASLAALGALLLLAEAGFPFPLRVAIVMLVVAPAAAFAFGAITRSEVRLLLDALSRQRR